MTKSVISRSDIESIVPPAQVAFYPHWIRELVLQIVCLRAELSGRDVRELAAEVLPQAHAPLNEQPFEHALRDVIGARR